MQTRVSVPVNSTFLSRYIPLILCFLYCTSPLHRQDDAFIQYVTGVQLLETNKILTQIEKVKLYRALKLLTGYDSQKALQKVKVFSQSPTQWKETLEETQKYTNKIIGKK